MKVYCTQVDYIQDWYYVTEKEATTAAISLAENGEELVSVEEIELMKNSSQQYTVQLLNQDAFALSRKEIATYVAGEEIEADPNYELEHEDDIAPRRFAVYQVSPGERRRVQHE